MDQNNWKQKILAIGGLAGAIIGLATAYLLIRTAEENDGGPPKINTKDAIRVALAIIGAARGIASLGEGK